MFRIFIANIFVLYAPNFYLIIHMVIISNSRFIEKG